MATEVINNNPLAPAENNQQSTATNTGAGVGGIGSCQGSSYISYGSFLQACALLSLINLQLTEMNIENTHFQLASSQAQQALTEARANKQALSSWLDMGASLLGATTTIGGLLADNVNFGEGSAQDLGNTLSKQTNELANLQQINTAATNKLTQLGGAPNMVQGEVGQGAEAVIANPELKDLADSNLTSKPIIDPANPSETELDARAEITRSKGFESQEDADAYFSTEKGRANLEERMKAIDTQKSVETINSATNSDADRAALQKIKENSDQAINNQYKAIEATNGKWTAKRGYNKMITEFINQTGKAGFDMGKAIATQEAGAKEAGAQAAQFSQQQLQSLWQEIVKNIGANLSAQQSFMAAMTSGR